MACQVSRRLSLAASRLCPARPHIPHIPSRALHQGSRPLARFQARPGRVLTGVAGVRGFHIAPFVQGSVQVTEHLITTLHATSGASWFITLPLVALAVSLFRLPFFIYSQRIAQKRAGLHPFFLAWNAKLRQAVQREAVQPEKREKEVLKRYTRASKRIYRAWGLQQWKMHGSLLGFPFWLCVIESVRRLCGGPRGALGSLFFGAKGAESGSAPTSAGSAAPPPPSATLGAQEALDAAPLTVDGSPAAPGPGMTASALDVSAIDPSLATGGCLWFPNLLEADPYHILPMLLSATIVFNLLPESRTGKLALLGVQDKSNTKLAESGGRRALQRGLLALGLAIGPLTMDLPAALHLYWISTSGFSVLMQRGIRKSMPIPRSSVRPCTGFERMILRPAPSGTRPSGSGEK